MRDDISYLYIMWETQNNPAFIKVYIIQYLLST